MKSKLLERQENIQCGICLMTVNRPVRCRGSCQKLFCLQCAVEGIINGQPCPNRCSTPFAIQIPQREWTFRCPIKPQKCTLPIRSLIQKYRHGEICEFTSAQAKLELYHQQTFSCECGKQLSFLDYKGLETIYGIDIYHYASQQICAKYKNIGICRAVCLSCSSRIKRLVYCPKCRPIPCTKTMCPLGHTMKYKQKIAKKRYCDLCDVPEYLIGQGGYGYCPCDFDLCEVCQNQSPNINVIVPLTNRLKQFYKVAMIEDVSEQSQWIQNAGSLYK